MFRCLILFSNSTGISAKAKAMPSATGGHSPKVHVGTLLLVPFLENFLNMEIGAFLFYIVNMHSFRHFHDFGAVSSFWDIVPGPTSFQVHSFPKEMQL